MKPNRIIEQFDASKAIIERWGDSASVPTIEKDILLTNLQDIYKQVMALPSQAVVKNSTTREAENDSVVEFIIEPEEFVEEPTELIVVEQPIIELVVAPTFEPTIEPEEAPMDYPEPIIEEPVEAVPEFRVVFGQRVPNEMVDKFVMELFWRDEQFFNNEVSKLVALPTLDAALFYICEKYNWSAQSKTAEQFTELLANYQFEQ